MTEEVLEEVNERVLLPTVRGMRDEGIPFCGCLFTGLMITENGPRVLEYNVRFGDPETQSLLPLVETDLIDVILACTQGMLGTLNLAVSAKMAATVVVAAGGYPDTYEKGTLITLDPLPDDILLFHAGTAVDGEGVLRTSGGRVIASTATAESLESAIDKAYQGVSCIRFKGMQYRRDIGARALK